MNAATEAAARAYVDVLRRRHPGVVWAVVPGEGMDLLGSDPGPGQVRRTLAAEQHQRAPRDRGAPGAPDEHGIDRGGEDVPALAERQLVPGVADTRQRERR